MEEKNLDVVAYCGLCCLDCHGHTGKIADLARDLRKELRQAKYGKFADAIAKTPFGKPFVHYQQCYDLLGAMVKVPVQKWMQGWRWSAILQNQTVLPGKTDYRLLGMQ